MSRLIGTKCGSMQPTFLTAGLYQLSGQRRPFRWPYPSVAVYPRGSLGACHVPVTCEYVSVAARLHCSSAWPGSPSCASPGVGNCLLGHLCSLTTPCRARLELCLIIPRGGAFLLSPLPPTIISSAAMTPPGPHLPVFALWTPFQR